MGARREVLQRLRATRRAVNHPAPWKSRRHFDDLAERFAQALTAAHGEVWRAADLDEALERLGAFLAEIGASRVIVNHEPPLDGLDFPARWPHIEWFVVGQTPGDLRAFAASADVGISGAQAALAETGTVVVCSGPGRSRLTTLLPPVHVAFVPVARLTVDLFTWVADRRPNPMPANVVFVSGPSKTADIEQTLAVGVHGPTRFIAVLCP